MNNSAIKIWRTFLCILVLSAYAGCSSVFPNSMSQPTSSQEILNSFENPQPQQLPVKNVEVTKADGGVVTFKVQVADTMPTRTKGLMFRQEMPEDEGMIFLFDDEHTLSFWMLNTLIPLDIIYIGKDWKVVSIQKNVPPCKSEVSKLRSDPCDTYPSKGNAQYVLEINGGLSDKLGIQEGATVQLQ